MLNLTATSNPSLSNNLQNTSLFLLNPLKPPPYLPFFNFTKPLPLSSFSLQPPPLSLPPPPRSASITRVSTASVEYAPDSDFHNEISRLKDLKSRLFAAKSVEERMRVLKSDSRVEKYLNLGNEEVLGAAGLGIEELVLIRSLVAAGQGHVVGVDEEEEVEVEKKEFARSSVKEALYALVEMIEKFEVKEKRKGNYCGGLREEEVLELRKLVKCLREVEEFYDCIGGIIGYQITVLELLADSTREKQTMNWSQHIEESMDCQFLEIHTPGGLDLSKSTEYASQAALWGIEGLPDLGEIYPLGGSADRLGLVDPDTGECLPAAMLPFCGRTLLEGLIRDVQAREFLYFKLYGRQCITPIAIMTSSAKNNHERITSLCERLGWFGRGQSSFQLFEQPLVPAVSAEDGQWLVRKPFVPVCKPGGHGVIWKLAYDKGVFQWFYNHGRKGATVRQVSNVVAATDLTLLTLAGIGLRHGKKLGFASCKRTAGATEGINALIEKKNLNGLWAYGLSCIEYTEFDKFGIPSEPVSSNSFQAQFPANTNILYVDLPAVELIASSDNEKCLPGMVLNTKKPVVYADYFGNCHSVPGGRLECTMQNIADNFVNTYSSRCYQGVEEELDTFIVYNERRRVTSSAKKKRKYTDNSMHQTPDGSLLDILRNACDILSHCDVEVPQIESNETYADSGPPFLILLHPALGPLWEVTRQKFEGGSISYGSELQIEVAEFLWRNVELDGSMIILADNVMGSMRIDESGEPILQYGHRCGRCRLHNVKVLNQGIDWSCGDNIYWKHYVKRDEVCTIILHGNAEFEARDVTLQGNHTYEVPDGYKMKITSGNSGLDVQLNPIETIAMHTGSWYWNYKKNGNHVLLDLVEL